MLACLELHEPWEVFQLMGDIDSQFPPKYVTLYLSWDMVGILVHMQACQRHWTYGGTLRKVETGAGKRNSRRARGSGSICTSEIGAPVQTKYPRHSQDVPHQNWAHENCMQHRAQSMPHAPGCNPSYFENNMADHNSSEANMSFQEGSSWKEGSSFNPDMVRCQASAQHCSNAS